MEEGHLGPPDRGLERQWRGCFDQDDLRCCPGQLGNPSQNLSQWRPMPIYLQSEYLCLWVPVSACEYLWVHVSACEYLWVIRVPVSGCLQFHLDSNTAAVSNTCQSILTLFGISEFWGPGDKRKCMWFGVGGGWVGWGDIILAQNVTPGAMDLQPAPEIYSRPHVALRYLMMPHMAPNTMR